MTPSEFPLRLAATVMLARDTSAGLELLMVRRSARSPFAPDAFVFPGGTVDPQDYADTPSGWTGRIADEFRAFVSPALPSSEAPVTERDALALVNAAVRELREEAAIAVETRELALFSQWITPPTEPRRYNTFFFAARAPLGALGTADAHETHDAQWIAPREALRRHEQGLLHLVYPTIKHLERLLHVANTEALLAFTRSKPIVTIMPWGAPSEGFVLPADLEGAW